MPKAIEIKAEFNAQIVTTCPMCDIKQELVVLPGTHELHCECGNFGRINADKIGNGLADVTVFWYWGADRVA